MPRFLSPEWVEAFNEALADMEVAPGSVDGSLAASRGVCSVSQVVRDVPGEGAVRTTLVIDQSGLRLHREDPDAAGPEADVTVVLSYPDAAALSRGELDPAEVLATGRVRVRGDLAVLAAASAVMAQAVERLADLHTVTTY